VFPSEGVRPASINDSGQPAEIVVDLIYPADTNITVFFTLSGTATRGVDYVLTNADTGQALTNSVTIPATSSRNTIYIYPLYNTNIFSDQSVILTMVPGSGYLINSNYVTATAIICQNPSIIFQPVTNLSQAIDIDYHPPTHSLIVSFNYPSGEPNNFALIGTNNTGTLLVSNWSGVNGAPDEVRLATVKQTANGFTNGDMYFGNDTAIGKLSADGTVSNMNWGLPTNTFDLGGLYVDQSGSFGGSLIAATGGGSYPDNMGVWKLDAQGHSTLMTNLPEDNLDGVITLTNDPARWGPWAGKIVTGNWEDGFIYTIDTNGVPTSYDTANLIPDGIAPDGFVLIPSNQDLYCCDQRLGQVLKLSRAAFTNNVGDLLITQNAVNVGDDRYPTLFIVHWDNVHSKFVVASIAYASNSSFLNQVTFAPINLPTH
jgi:hypothetical protein